jgi:hypothetical protein
MFRMLIWRAKFYFWQALNRCHFEPSMSGPWQGEGEKSYTPCFMANPWCIRFLFALPQITTAHRNDRVDYDMTPSLSASLVWLPEGWWLVLREKSQVSLYSQGPNARLAPKGAYSKLMSFRTRRNLIHYTWQIITTYKISLRPTPHPATAAHRNDRVN